MEYDQYDNKGLYTPQLEKDSCGVGLMADLANQPSHYIIDASLTMLERMEHRGACGQDPNTGDGAGLMCQLPHDFFREVAFLKSIKMPAKGTYSVGMFFFPKEKYDYDKCILALTEHVSKYGFSILFNRDVPIDNSDLGMGALQTEPKIQQIIFKNISERVEDLERRSYLLRSSLLRYIYEVYPHLVDMFYIASLSCKTIVYKGQLKATQLRKYYIDLQTTAFTSSVAVVHSRFSTNTIPKWKLAQPFRCIAHNGEINTIQGNINWWQAREKQYLSKSYSENKLQFQSVLQPHYKDIFPVCDPNLSDSGNFDNVIDFLLRENYSIPRTLMMMIPEAWQNDEQMSTAKRAFYEYHDGLMEPWDGPACICFTDGTLAGATLDRNGLRPARYSITNDNVLVMASEAGCVDIDPANVKYKGRLEPGKMLLADLSENRILTDDEIKSRICHKLPYEKWLEKYSLNLEELPLQTYDTSENYQIDNLHKLQIAFGMGVEDEEILLAAMAKGGAEPIGSMGADIPLAVLSEKPQHVSHYFKQQFAQVTNPPIDSIREKYFMTLATSIGAGSEIVNAGETAAQVIRCSSPILSKAEFNTLLKSDFSGKNGRVVQMIYKKGESLEQVIKSLCSDIIDFVKSGVNIICLSHTEVGNTHLPIPSLLMTGALHHACIDAGIRKEMNILVEGGDIWETHHVATLLSYGADLVCPFIAWLTVKKMALKENVEADIFTQKYKKALEKGLLKIMSKIGISTLASYKGAQTFEALGISQKVVDISFKGTITRIGGLTFEDLQKENELRYYRSISTSISPKNPSLQDAGVYRWRKKGEYHVFNPTTIHLLQHSTKTNDYLIYQRFAEEIDKLENNNSTLRSFIGIKKGEVIPIEEVESVELIMKRFATGAMSFGSISEEAHTTLAIAMNRIGGKSNSGEGGEDAKRYKIKKNGDWERSSIKQVASGRFGVNIHYLSEAEELQIKMAQGAKPGEGGQLPGNKVDNNIARVRNSTPGVGLISPPPHHDIYSIEDLAQLIYDLKNANEKARISVKLVSKAGVGVIASGVTKAHADHILISGCDGGTGASPLSSIRHAGLPWELGLSETHQTLIRNGLRDRVVVQTDGQIRTGRDMAVATMLGAEEWGIATAALVVEGCILMRKCHLNTCPVGVATQDKQLRKKFAGKVEYLVNYFNFLAEHLREIMASVGVRTVNELVGRTDLLEIRNTDKHWKSKNLNLETILFKEENILNDSLFASTEQNHGLENVLDRTLIKKAKHFIKHDLPFSDIMEIQSTDRAVGTLLSHAITKKHGAKGLKNSMIHFKFLGSAGQSFGAFGAKGLMFCLEGESNDYFGKGLSGAIITVYPNRKSDFESDQNIIIGNVALYGATKGEAYICGKAGDRFAVRNSGAHAVVEGIGDNGCEYMTGGTVIVLGDISRNFAAGMSGGIAYLYKHEASNNYLINQESVLLEKPTRKDLKQIKFLIENHSAYTGSEVADEIIENWELASKNFTKIFPTEYKKALGLHSMIQQPLKKVI